MLDIPRLERIRLTRAPITQRALGSLLLLSYKLKGASIEFENEERLPNESVIYAMNHTDRYNYFPFQVYLWRRHGRFTAAWVKGKYYESALLGAFMEKMNQLPTVSRGYLITKDFTETLGRLPSNEEYKLLRHWVDTAAIDATTEAPDPALLPVKLLSEGRNVLGHRFDPQQEDYAAYVNSIFHTMMRHFVALNHDVQNHDLDILIFPQGTRSVRLLPGHIGIAQIALDMKLKIIPVGCNGCDKLFPGTSPITKRGRVVYRIGKPIPYEELSEFHISESFEPFSAMAEVRHKREFEGVTALVTDRINELLDEPYQRAPDAGADAAKGADRFIVS